MVARHAEGLGDGIRGDVVMRGADAAGGEDIGVARPQRIHRRHDLLLHVRHDAGFLEVDAERRQVVREKPEVLVLGAAGEDFIADQEDGGCRLWGGHGA